MNWADLFSMVKGKTMELLFTVKANTAMPSSEFPSVGGRGLVSVSVAGHVAPRGLGGFAGRRFGCDKGIL